jgi:hypothetical protein
LQGQAAVLVAVAALRQQCLGSRACQVREVLLSCLPCVILVYVKVRGTVPSSAAAAATAAAAAAALVFNGESVGGAAEVAVAGLKGMTGEHAHFSHGFLGVRCFVVVLVLQQQLRQQQQQQQLRQQQQQGSGEMLQGWAAVSGLKGCCVGAVFMIFFCFHIHNSVCSTLQCASSSWKGVSGDPALPSAFIFTHSSSCGQLCVPRQTRQVQQQQQQQRQQQQQSRHCCSKAAVAGIKGAWQAKNAGKPGAALQTMSAVI